MAKPKRYSYWRLDVHTGKGAERFVSLRFHIAYSDVSKRREVEEAVRTWLRKLANGKITIKRVQMAGAPSGLTLVRSRSKELAIEQDLIGARPEKV